jgi:hypothetical protein
LQILLIRLQVNLAKMRSTRALIILTLALCGISARAQYAANAYTNAYAAGAGSPAPMPYMQGPGPVAQPQAGLPYGECRAPSRCSLKYRALRCASNLL